MTQLRRFRAYWLVLFSNLRRYHGLRTRNRRHFAVAESLLTRALALDHYHLNARMSRALLRWRELDNWVGAIEDFTTLLTLYPTYHEALFNRGMAHYRAGDYHASAVDLATFIQRDPHSRWVHHANIQLQGLYAIIEDLPKMLPSPDIPAINSPKPE